MLVPVHAPARVTNLRISGVTLSRQSFVCVGGEILLDLLYSTAVGAVGSRGSKLT